MTDGGDASGAVIIKAGKNPELEPLTQVFVMGLNQTASLAYSPTSLHFLLVRSSVTRIFLASGATSSDPMPLQRHRKSVTRISASATLRLGIHGGACHSIDGRAMCGRSLAEAELRKER